MDQEIKYMTLTVEDFPFGRKTSFFYFPVISGVVIGDVITSKSGRQYRIVDGKTQVPYKEIDLAKYLPFELM